MDISIYSAAGDSEGLNEEMRRELERQESVLSTSSDYDILDGHSEDISAEAGSDTYHGSTCRGYLRPHKSITIKVRRRETFSRTQHFHNAITDQRLYDIDCYHAGQHWSIVRKYSHFEDLHRSLRTFSTSIKRHSSDKTTPEQQEPQAKNSQLRNDSDASRESKKGQALKFPKKPEVFIITNNQMERRRARLEIYLSQVVSDPRYREHKATLKFLEISKISFMRHSGEKFHEGFVDKRSGGRKFPTLFSCFTPSASNWSRRWLVLKDSYVCYLRPNGRIADVMLFDKDVNDLKYGFASTRIRHGIKLSNTSRELAIKTTNYYKTRNWTISIERAISSCEYAEEQRYNSFAAQRKELANWYVDGEQYFSDVAEALESAEEEIFITDWWLTPELFLKRPILRMTDESRLDLILKKKAEQGVQVYILLYKDIKIAVGGIRSDRCKEYMENLHPNILVIRHPDHMKSLTYMWSHHEKIVCIDQRIAFLGGLDMCFGRWDNSEHKLTDLGSIRTVTPDAPRETFSSSSSWKGIGLSDMNIKPEPKRQSQFYIREHKKAVKSSSDANIRKKIRANSLIAAERPLSAFLSTHKSGSDNIPTNGSKASRRFSVDTGLINGSRLRTHSDSALKNVVLSETQIQPKQLDGRELSHPVIGEPRLIRDSSGEQEVFEDSSHSSGSTRRSEFSGSGTEYGRQPVFSVTVEREESRESIEAVNVLPFTSQPETLGQQQFDGLERLHSGGFMLETDGEELTGQTEEAPQFTQSSKVRHESAVSLKLEPITSLSTIVLEAYRKSKGKTPNPPSKSAFTMPSGDRIASDTVSLTDVPTVTPEETPRKTSRSWKKLRSNLDKVRTIVRHEHAMRTGSVMDTESRKSSGSCTPVEQGLEGQAKYWIGKDYVNWIVKDLSTPKKPFMDHVDRTATVRMPWHDIGCVVFNKAATDVARHFIQRWNHAKKIKESTKANDRYPLLLPRSTHTSYRRLPAFIKDLCELVNCQVVRSCGGWSCGMFKPEHSIYNAYIDLIEKSQHYIYIENQFFISWCGTEVSNCICEALVNRILRAHKEKKLFRVYIVLPLLPAFEADLDPATSGGSAMFAVLHWIQQSLCGHDNSLFGKLNKHKLDPNQYVTVCSLRQYGELHGLPVTELVYVHSKLMIVDDKKCIIGSANINDRSLTGERDSEIAVVIEDDLFIDSTMSGQPYKAGKFCYSLRNNIFQEHLGLQTNEFIQDITVKEFYQNRWISTAFKNTNIFEKVFHCLPSDMVVDLDASFRSYKTQQPLANSSPIEALTLLRKVKGHLVTFPLNFLARENLLERLGAKERIVPNKFWT